jgi:hypothetical protein
VPLLENTDEICDVRRVGRHLLPVGDMQHSGAGFVRASGDGDGVGGDFERVSCFGEERLAGAR